MNLLREAQAGLHAGTAASVQALTHGIIAFAAMGAAGIAYGIAAALAVSGAAALSMAMIGRSRPLVANMTAASAIVVGVEIAAARPESFAEAVAISLAIVMLSGLLIVLLATTGLARLTAMMPAAVSQGLRNATAAMVVISVRPIMLGGNPGDGWPSPVPGAMLIAGCALVLVLRPVPGLPGPVVALAVATAAHHGLLVCGVPVGPEASHLLSPSALASEIGAAWSALAASPLPLSRVLPGAATIALRASIETLAAAATLREISGRRTEYGRDLLGAGTGMLASAGLGGVPASALTVP